VQVGGEREQVESLLLRHHRVDPGAMGRHVPEDAEEAPDQVGEPVVLAPIGFVGKPIEEQIGPAARERKRLSDECCSVEGEPRDWYSASKPTSHRSRAALLAATIPITLFTTKRGPRDCLDVTPRPRQG
jgi:hypothetical protein